MAGLPRVGLPGDLIESASGLDGPERKWDDHLADQIAGAGAGAVPAQRDGDIDRDREMVGGFPTGVQQPTQAARGHRQEHVVHCCLMVVRDPGDLFEGAADESESAVRPDEEIQAGLRPGLLDEDLPDGRPPGPYSPDGPRRVGDDSGRASQAGQAPADVVSEQLKARRPRCGGPGWRGRAGHVGGRSQQRSQGRHDGDAVGDDVVQPDEHADPPLREPRQEPDLPQWSAPIEPAAAQPFGGLQQLRLVTRGRDLRHLNVAA